MDWKLKLMSEQSRSRGLPVGEGTINGIRGQNIRKSKQQVHNSIGRLKVHDTSNQNHEDCLAERGLSMTFLANISANVKITTRYLLPELAVMCLTTKLCSCVSEAFISKFGKYAGWAQNVLFVSELSSQKALQPSHAATIKDKKSAKGKQKRNKVTVEVILEA